MSPETCAWTARPSNGRTSQTAREVFGALSSFKSDLHTTPSSSISMNFIVWSPRYLGCTARASNGPQEFDCRYSVALRGVNSDSIRDAVARRLVHCRWISGGRDIYRLWPIAELTFLATPILGYRGI